MTEVRLVGIEKRYSKNTAPAVAGVDLTIGSEEFFVLLGPSGCGKSTLLRLIAGLEEPTSGELYIADELVNYVSPVERNVAMVFQNYALYPHMSAGDNVRFPLKMRRVARAEIAPAVEQAGRILGLDEELLRRPVGQLSGGQRQRVALARAIVRRPRVMLMDEPLSNLDAVLRSQTREELLTLHRAVPTTVVYVTHDQIEAMTMGDRIAVMNHGLIVQVGTPAEVYDEPVDRFVGSFVGSPPMNFLPGTVEQRGDVAMFVGEALSAALPRSIGDRVGPTPGQARFELGVRPEGVALVAGSAQAPGRWTVEVIEQLGAERIVRLRAGRDVVRARAGRELPIAEGDRLDLAVAERDVHLFRVRDASARNVMYEERPANGAASEAADARLMAADAGA